MQDAEDTLEAYRSANSALEALKPAELPSTPTVRSLAGRVTGGDYGYQQEEEAAAQERIKVGQRLSYKKAFAVGAQIRVAGQESGAHDPKPDGTHHHGAATCALQQLGGQWPRCVCV